MRSGCVKSVFVAGVLGLSCCGLSLWATGIWRPAVDRPSLPDDLETALPSLRSGIETAIPPLRHEIETALPPVADLLGVEPAPTARQDRGAAVAPYRRLPTPEPSATLPLSPFTARVPAGSPALEPLLRQAASRAMAEAGYELRLEQSPEEPGIRALAAACQATAGEDHHVVATSVELLALCPDRLVVGIPVAQSTGNDVVLARDGASWQDAAVAGAWAGGAPDAAALLCLGAHVVNEPPAEIRWSPDAAEIVDGWSEATPSIVALSLSDAQGTLDADSDAGVLLSSRDARMPWHVLAFSNDWLERSPESFDAFTRAYFAGLRELAAEWESTNATPGGRDGAQAGRDGTPGAAASGGTVTRAFDVAAGQAGSEWAYATLGDAALVMSDPSRLGRRLADMATVWQTCGLDAPARTVREWSAMVRPEFVMAARQLEVFAGAVDKHPGTEVFEAVEQFDPGVIADGRVESARVALEEGVWLTFAPGDDDYDDPEAAEATLAEVVRYLRGCQDCLARIQGSNAEGPSDLCAGCAAPETPAVALERARRVYYDLRLRLAVPEDQLLLLEEPRPPAFPGSDVEADLRQDRRVYVTGGPRSGG